MALVPNQRMNAVFFGEPFRQLVFVLPNTLHEIGGHACIERTVSATGKDINAGLFHHARLLDSGLRRNDGAIEMSADGSSSPARGEGSFVSRSRDIRVDP